MKRIVNKLTRDEKGSALLGVLILLLIGGLIIAPLLGFMSTGVLAGQMHEVKMEAPYAADAGIENAVWKLQNGEVDPSCTLTDINGMDVTVIELVPSESTENGTLYTLQSTAYLAGEIETQVVAQVEVVILGTVALGGTGGAFINNEDITALTLIDEDTFAFNTQGSSKFKGRNEGGFGPDIWPEDLWSVNMDTGTSAQYLEGNDVMANPLYNIAGAHYYQDEVDGYEYLLLTLKGKKECGTPAVLFGKSDIFKLHIDSADPQRWETELVHTVDTGESAEVVALTRRDDTGAIIFSIHSNTVIGGTAFEKGEAIEYNPSDGSYTSLFDAKDILGTNLIIDALAVLPGPDQRLLVSFYKDPVTGSDGEEIQAEDIAIWDPAANTINVHIGMRGQPTDPAPLTTTVRIVSWEINP